MVFHYRLHMALWSLWEYTKLAADEHNAVSWKLKLVLDAELQVVWSMVPVAMDNYMLIRTRELTYDPFYGFLHLALYFAVWPLCPF